MLLKLIIISIILLGMAFAGIAVKMFFIKDSEFRKSCGSIDPTTGARSGCSCSNNSATSCSNK